MSDYKEDNQMDSKDQNQILVVDGAGDFETEKISRIPASGHFQSEGLTVSQNKNTSREGKESNKILQMDSRSDYDLEMSSNDAGLQDRLLERGE